VADTKCGDLFGGWDKVMAIMATTTYDVMKLGEPTVAADGTIRAVGALTSTDNTVFINSQGFFFNQNVYVSSTGKFGYFDFGTGLAGGDWAWECPVDRRK
jgi:hypothetical protein